MDPSQRPCDYLRAPVITYAYNIRMQLDIYMLYINDLLSTMQMSS